MANINPFPAARSPFRAYNVFNIVSFTVGAKSVNTINVAMQLRDAHNQNIAQVAHLEVYLASTAAGLLSAVATTSALAVGTNGQLLAITVTGLVCELVTDSSGRVDLNVIQTAGGTPYYLVVRMPDGSIAVSSVIQF